MNWADWVIIGIIAVSSVISIIRGFVREVLSLLAWVIAFWLAFRFYAPLGDTFSHQVSVASVRYGISFLVIFVVALIILAIINHFMGYLVDKTGLTGTDRMIGIVFGLARGVLVVTVLLILAAFTPLKKDNWWQESALVPKFKPVEVWLRQLMQAHLPKTLLKKLQSKETQAEDEATQGTADSVETQSISEPVNTDDDSANGANDHATPADKTTTDKSSAKKTQDTDLIITP